MGSEDNQGRNSDGGNEVGSCILSVLQGNFTHPESAAGVLEEALAFADLSVVDGRSTRLGAQSWAHVFLLEESHAALRILTPSKAVFEIYSCRPIESSADFYIDPSFYGHGISLEMKGVFYNRNSPLEKIIELLQCNEINTRKFPIVVRIPDETDHSPFHNDMSQMGSYEELKSQYEKRMAERRAAEKAEKQRERNGNHHSKRLYDIMSEAFVVVKGLKRRPYKKEINQLIGDLPKDSEIFTYVNNRNVVIGETNIRMVEERVMDLFAKQGARKNPFEREVWATEYGRYLRAWKNGNPEPADKKVPLTNHYFASSVIHGIPPEVLQDADMLNEWFCVALAGSGGIEDAWDFETDGRYSSIVYGGGFFHAMHAFAQHNSVVLTSNSYGQGHASCKLLERMASRFREQGPITVYSRSHSLDTSEKQEFTGQEMPLMRA